MARSDVGTSDAADAAARLYGKKVIDRAVEIMRTPPGARGWSSALSRAAEEIKRQEEGRK
jgi:hypothetical protein